MTPSQAARDDAFFLQKTFTLAQESIQKGNHPFGALLVYQNQIMAVAHNTVNSERDVTCHAELNLISWASQNLSLSQLASATLYSSTEPCAMCSGAIVWSGVRKVVYASSAQALAEITGTEFYTECRSIFDRQAGHFSVVGPVLEEEGNKLHFDFW
jgi:tRNA(Arg) A34 adenosine deaminase TadA